MGNENKQPVTPKVIVSKREKPKKEEKKATPSKPATSKINYNKEKSYIKTGIVCTIITVLVVIFTIFSISNAKSFNEELVTLYVWVCIVLFVVALLPVLVASIIALVTTIERLKKELVATENKEEKKTPSKKKIVEIVWYSLLILAPLVITCITLTNL
ncbi:MAG: hypothetical protein IJ400_02825 [Clostridia bacterium]|nr:hypothetical protein [Clostridia bacterium]